MLSKVAFGPGIFYFIVRTQKITGWSNSPFLSQIEGDFSSSLYLNQNPYQIFISVR